MWRPLDRLAQDFINASRYAKKRAAMRRAKELVSQGLLPYPLTLPIDEELLNINGLDIGHSAIQVSKTVHYLLFGQLDSYFCWSSDGGGIF